MVIVTPSNFDVNNVVIEGDKNRIFYKQGDKKLPLEIANHGEISSPAIVNGLTKELNYSNKKPTGNYRPGLQIVQDMNNMTQSEKKLYQWYDELFKKLKQAVSDAGIEDELIVDKKTLPFIRHPYKKDDKNNKNNKKKRQYDFTKPPKLWGNCFYTKLDGESDDPDNPDNIKVKLTITDEKNVSIDPEELVNKRFKCFYTFQIYNYQSAPDGIFVFPLRLKSLKVKVLGDVQTSNYISGQITEKFDENDDEAIDANF